MIANSWSFHFLGRFDGTGTKKAKYPSNFVLGIHDPNDINEWKYHKCVNKDGKNKYVNKIYDRLIISVRKKGMPKIHKKYVNHRFIIKTTKEKRTIDRIYHREK